MQKSTLKIVKNKIINSKKQDKIWSCSDFKNLPFDSVVKALSDLSRENIIKRIQKGYYYRPKTTILGEVPPDYLNLIVAKLSKKAGFYCISGLSGYNLIGLTTQVSNIVTIACDYPMRNTDRVKFILRKKPHSGSQIERIVLDALIDIDNIPDCSPQQVIMKIKELIAKQEISMNDLIISALQEPPRVKAIIGALAQELDLERVKLQKLRNSLNPGTSYFSDIFNMLRYADEWKIKPTKNGGKIS